MVIKQCQHINFLFKRLEPYPYGNLQVYIVYMGSLPEGKYSPLAHQLSLLKEVIGSSSSIEKLLVHNYKRSFNGFAAKLSDHEVQKLANKKEVVSVFPSRTFQVQTTRSWSFMGFDENLHTNQHVESDIIVGVFDTGIWPESASFNDEGYSPPPRKWKGSCNGGKNFTCNNKIIGARYYGWGSSDSARDEVGHGTHTASTAAGNKVIDASLLGIAQGTARGGVPSARIAAYKICSVSGCAGADILAAFDDAIADGVDVISLSLGFLSAQSYDEDPIAIGSFHAMVKGIFISQSAGNSGMFGTVSSVAPWILSVAASSIDRQIINKVVLGNGQTYTGNSINTFSLEGPNFPLIYERNASKPCSHSDGRFWRSECLDSDLVKGKIVLCDFSSGESAAMGAGAVGSIVRNGGYEDVSYVVPFPSVHLNSKNFDAVKSYMESSSQPVATILKSESINDSSAPVVASFSSLGPNLITLDLLKPDISAPGIDILAAYPDDISPTEALLDERRVQFNILSGTSMSCPHAASIAAYVKTFHPEWSPSAIKSAIMTTALPMNAAASSYAEFAYGSGHVNPLKAIDPGLVYGAHKADYIKFLCSISYTDDMVRRISGDNSTCPQVSQEPKDLNYPSMTARVEPEKSFTISFYRTVTNVGFSNLTYEAKVFTNSGLEIKVVPQVLSFKSVNEEKSFNVTVVGRGLADRKMSSASLVWSDGTHVVRSPIVVHAYV
ncbi:subtilisin-like protease SBT4.4 isoform X1 [Mercurialis annua]|uniref:subtilisin-like protease SBT4.4 isoform X1 n=1 Tax=Mercurialis annua TaxID=3986 RepID=UPI00215EDD3E|nr:subtilisin-like protease SBT4.4 isoform X1 [Mercurialis annua]XP_055962264.1 subtilisin-like protease SBT4.4 isoform X1 [Mercurialis annua]